MKPVDFKPTIEWNKPVWYLAALLAALSMLGPFAIDTYLPAFEGIQADIGASAVAMQQTLSAYLLGFSIMMLLHGALADSFGRRPIILINIAVFGLSSVVCALAQHVGVLVLGRILQGMSCGAGIVVGRAIVRDLFTASNAQRLMSQITLFFGVAPAIAPIIGGWLFTLIGWRAIFVFLAVVSALLWLLTWFELPETLPPNRRQDFHPGSLMRGYWSVLSDSASCCCPSRAACRSMRCSFSSSPRRPSSAITSACRRRASSGSSSAPSPASWAARGRAAGLRERSRANGRSASASR